MSFMARGFALGARIRKVGSKVRGLKRRGGVAFGRLRQRGGQFAYMGGRARAIGTRVRSGARKLGAHSTIYGAKAKTFISKNKTAVSVASAAALGLGGTAYLLGKYKENRRG